MAYRFNSGMGGVTCDKCSVLIDQNLSHDEYVKSYAKSHAASGGKDICWRCKAGKDRKRTSLSK